MRGCLSEQSWINLPLSNSCLSLTSLKLYNSRQLAKKRKYCHFPSYFVFGNIDHNLLKYEFYKGFCSENHIQSSSYFKLVINQACVRCFSVGNHRKALIFFSELGIYQNKTVLMMVFLHYVVTVVNILTHLLLGP